MIATTDAGKGKKDANRRAPVLFDEASYLLPNGRPIGAKLLISVEVGEDVKEAGISGLHELSVCNVWGGHTYADSRSC